MQKNIPENLEPIAASQHSTLCPLIVCTTKLQKKTQNKSENTTHRDPTLKKQKSKHTCKPHQTWLQLTDTTTQLHTKIENKHKNKTTQVSILPFLLCFFNKSKKKKKSKKKTKKKTFSIATKLALDYL